MEGVKAETALRKATTDVIAIIFRGVRKVLDGGGRYNSLEKLSNTSLEA